MRSGFTSGLGFKLGAAMVVVMVVALGLTTGLNLLRFQETYERLLAQRLEVTAREIARQVTLGLDLGLRVEAMDNLPGLLRQHAAQHPDLTALVVQDCAERTLVAAGPAPDGAHPGRGRTTGDSWRVFSRAGIGVGLVVRDNMGACAAGVALAAAPDAAFRVLDGVARSHLLVALTAALGAACAAIGAAILFTSRRGPLRRIEDDLCAIAAGIDPPPLDLPPTAFGNRWERDLAAGYLDARPVLLAHAGLANPVAPPREPA